MYKMLIYTLFKNAPSRLSSTGLEREWGTKHSRNYPWPQMSLSSELPNKTFPQNHKSLCPGDSMLTKEAVSFPRKEAWTVIVARRDPPKGWSWTAPWKRDDSQQAEMSVAKAGQTYWLWCYLEQEKRGCRDSPVIKSTAVCLGVYLAVIKMPWP